MNGVSKIAGWVVSVAVLLALWCQSGIAQETATPETGEAASQGVIFAGPGSVPGQQADDARSAASFAGDAIFQGYLDWKDGLLRDHGFSYSLDYTIGMLSATETLTEKDGGVGAAARFYGSWDLLGRESDNTGSFVWKVEHRHRITEIPASEVKNEAGYVGLILPTLSDLGVRLTNLYWKQLLREGRLEFIVGMLDTTDWVDVYALASPWTGFFNYALATGSATIPVPDDGTLGAYLNAMMTDHVYLMAGLTDSNADSTDPFAGFDTFSNDREYFTSLELGWIPAPDRFYLNNMHVTLWHVDERETAGVADGWGASVSLIHTFEDRWMPFLRGGYAKDGGSLLQKSVSAGLGYHLQDEKSLLGVGLNWSEPNEDTFEPGLDDQFTAELFCRFQVKRNIQITPDVQYIVNPALNPEANDTWVLGVRARIVL